MLLFAASQCTHPTSSFLASVLCWSVPYLQIVELYIWSCYVPDAQHNPPFCLFSHVLSCPQMFWLFHMLLLARKCFCHDLYQPQMCCCYYIAAQTVPFWKQTVESGRLLWCWLCNAGASIIRQDLGPLRRQDYLLCLAVEQKRTQMSDVRDAIVQKLPLAGYLSLPLLQFFLLWG